MLYFFLPGRKRPKIQELRIIREKGEKRELFSSFYSYILLAYFLPPAFIVAVTFLSLELPPAKMV